MDWKGRLLWRLVKPYYINEIRKQFNLKFKILKSSFYERGFREEEAYWFNIQRTKIYHEYDRLRVVSDLIHK